MKRLMKTLTILAIAMILSSFSNKPSDQFVGTYGVSSSDPSQIKLILHSDNTFYYQDFSMSDNKIVASGNWTLRGNKVVLHDSDTEFHSVWSFGKTGEIAKSRKGLSYYRLCKVD